jgi:hypothetical protein
MYFMERKRTYGRKADLALGLWVKLSRAYSSFGRLSHRDIAQYGLTTRQFFRGRCWSVAGI